MLEHIKNVLNKCGNMHDFLRFLLVNGSRMVIY